LDFYENQLKVSDVEGKIVLTPWSSTATSFKKPLKKRRMLVFLNSDYGAVKKTLKLDRFLAKVW